MKALIPLGVLIPLGMMALGMMAPGPMAAHADEPFRCGKWIASSAMSVGELVAKCGQPAARASETRDVRVRNRNNGLMYKSGTTTVETWTFDRGTTAPPMTVTIVDGRITNIERKK
jgi:hypothetical protein